MRVAMDARGINWYKGTGIGTYTEKLLKYMIRINKQNYYHIYWSGDEYTSFEEENTKIIMASKKHSRFFEQYYFPANLVKEKIDLYHVPQNGIGLLEDINCKKIVTIHDLIPYVMPETVGKGYLLKFLKELPKVIEACDAILTVSEWSKKDILKYFPIDEKKIFVTPLAADKKYKLLNKEKCQWFLRQYYHINSPYILYIGGFSPRKNVTSLLLAFSKICSKLDKEYKLVIVGAKKEDAPYLSVVSDNLDLSSKVIFTGFVEENHLPILYNGSDVFVYPSLYEGFGLPPLEAMSCGTPVITSNVSSIPEVVENSGILINPFDTAALMESLASVLSNKNLQKELSMKGLARSNLFSWSKTAEETLKVYEKICTTS